MVVKLDAHAIEHTHNFVREAQESEPWLFVFLTWYSPDKHIIVQVSYEYLLNEEKEGYNFYQEFVELGVSNDKEHFNLARLENVKDMESFEALMKLIKKQEGAAPITDGALATPLLQ